VALLAINENAALVGYETGQVRTEHRGAEENLEQWYERMRNQGLPIWQRENVDHEEFDRLLAILRFFRVIIQTFIGLYGEPSAYPFRLTLMKRQICRPRPCSIPELTTGS